MSQETSPEAAPGSRAATEPFTDKNADLILRSSDRVDFYVHKLVLSLASPTFQSMFTLPKPTSPTTTALVRGPGNNNHKDGLPITQLTEDTTTLDIILRACYPYSVPKIGDLETLQRVLEAAEKYEVEAFRGTAGLLLKASIETAPVTVYSMACRFGYADILTLSAKACLAVEFNEILRTPPPVLRMMDNVQYQRLLQYHRKCGEVASQVPLDRSWRDCCYYLLDFNKRGCGKCQEVERRPIADASGKRAPEPKEKWYAPDYVWDYLARAGPILKERPVPSVVLEPDIFPIVPLKWCDCCVYRMAGLDKFGRIFSEAVANALSTVVSNNPAQVIPVPPH